MPGRYEVTPDVLGGEAVARKAPRPGSGGREELRARLLHEGRCLTALGGGAHVLGCRAVDADAPALLLEWAPGGSLAAWLGARPRPPAAWADRVARELAAALGHAHAHGLVHRDVKPSNLLLAADGGVRLADFGVAARVGDRGALGPEWEEDPVGTLGYAAPEQLAGEPAHPAADVYGMAAVLYELATGHLPWELRPGESEADLRARVVRGELVPGAGRWGVEPRRAEVLARALAPEVGRRQPGAKDLWREWRGE